MNIEGFPRDRDNQEKIPPQLEVPISAEDTVSTKIQTEKRELREREPNQLAKASRLLSERLFDVETEGLENLEEIPEGTPIIFVTTHMCDYEVPIVAGQVGKYYDVAVADASTHESPFKNPGGYMGRLIGGRRNFLSVDFTGKKGTNKQGIDGRGAFNPNNYKLMRRRMKEDGRPVVMAGYFDTNYVNHKWQLPNRGGNGAAFLSQIVEGAVLVPVAVDIKSEKPFGMGTGDVWQVLMEKPETRVAIGKAIMPSKIEKIENFGKILTKRKRGVKLTAEDRGEFSRIHQEIEGLSAQIMSSLAEMLPKEKRGKWGAESPEKSTEIKEVE